MGFPSSFDGSRAAVDALPMDDKMRFTTNLKTFVREHPSEFSAALVASANAGVRRSLDAAELEGTVSIAISNIGAGFEGLGEGFENTIVKPLASVGDGVAGLVSIAGKLLPFLIIAGVYIVIVRTGKIAG